MVYLYFAFLINFSLCHKRTAFGLCRGLLGNYVVTHHLLELQMKMVVEESHTSKQHHTADLGKSSVPCQGN